MDIIQTAMCTTIAGIANGSVLPIGNVIEEKGIAAEGNSIILKPGTYYVNAVFNIEGNAKIIANKNDKEIESATGCGIVPIGFKCGNGKIFFTIECSEPVTLRNVLVSVFKA